MSETTVNEAAAAASCPETKETKGKKHDHDGRTDGSHV